VWRFRLQVLVLRLWRLLPCERRALERYAEGLRLMDEGKAAEALVLWEPLAREHRLGPWPQFYELLPGHIALALAHLGELHRARQWLEEAFRRCPPKDVRLCQTEAVLLCREGHFGAAIQLLEERLKAARRRGLHFETPYLVLAYARSKVDPERYAPDILRTMLHFPPFPPHVVARLSIGWTDFALFLREWSAKAERCREEKGPGWFLG
jgi:tetratricopeptide (TPR) repeat protein